MNRFNIFSNQNLEYLASKYDTYIHTKVRNRKKVGCGTGRPASNKAARYSPAAKLNRAILSYEAANRLGGTGLCTREHPHDSLKARQFLSPSAHIRPQCPYMIYRAWHLYKAATLRQPRQYERSHSTSHITWEGCWVRFCPRAVLLRESIWTVPVVHLIVSLAPYSNFGTL